jgi:hypothetical protein
MNTYDIFNGASKSEAYLASAQRRTGNFEYTTQKVIQPNYFYLEPTPNLNNPTIFTPAPTALYHSNLSYSAKTPREQDDTGRKVSLVVVIAFFTFSVLSFLNNQ